MYFSRGVIMASFAMLLLAGCSTPKPPESPKVRADVVSRCASAEALLAKNYSRTRNVDLLVAGGGETISLRGAILSAEAADRVAKADTMCKAWANGALTDEQYASYLLSSLADSASVPQSILDSVSGDSKISGTPSDISVDELLRRIEELEATGGFPPGIDKNEIRSTLNNFKNMSDADRAEQIDSEFEKRLGQVETQGAETQRLRIETSQVIANLIERLDNLEQALQDIQTTPAMKMPFRVYFTTGSDELTFASMRYLDALIEELREDARPLAVTGYTDPRGTTAANAELSVSRANTVAQYLRDNLNVPVVARGGNVADLDTIDISKMRYADIAFD
ncbi:OmpA family protein [Croceicoccus sp. YJ47]|uniref:OmpA family protein n=1 Tax=Croceicoccus sp. YJ47 TaxID=2798724 RepID=UPI0019245EA4|nr:OmpA family protein [Croceicoccus sp. YJ47]QQN74415.1 OmpA family protein [Croceicoccus sp. YJ47]